MSWLERVVRRFVRERPPPQACSDECAGCASCRHEDRDGAMRGLTARLRAMSDEEAGEILRRLEGGGDAARAER